MSLPDWLLWLLPVPVMTAAAIAWTAWRSRTPGLPDTAESVREYERFRAAMSGEVPPPRERKRPPR